MATAAGSKKTLREVASFEHGAFTFTPDGPRRKTTVRRLVDIIRILCSEHKYFESLLDTLESEAVRLKPGRIPDYHLLLDIVDYLTRYPDKYHHPREDLLFNGMLERDRKFQPKLDRLLREHKTLQHYNKQLFRQLSEIANGASVNRTELLESINRYVYSYRQHIEYESQEIFPQAHGTLKAADIRKLAAKTNSLDDPLFGDKVQERYRRLGRSIQATLGTASEELVAREMSAMESSIETMASAIEKLNSLKENLPALKCRDKPEDGRGFGGLSWFAHKPSWQARVLNVCTRAVLKPMMQFGTIESMRSMTGRLDEQQARFLPQDVRTRSVNTGSYDGEWVHIAGHKAQRTLLYFPGGGFIMRTRSQHRAFVARICRSARARALVVHYRLAPEVPFPGGLEDCIAAYRDLLQQGCDPADITIAGDSAGGGLVLSTLLALRDEGTPLPANAIVLSPLADLTYSGESREFNKHRDPLLPNHRASAMHELYMGDALPKDRYLSPVLADFDSLPPMLGQVGSTEILLDDTVRAAAQAKKAGVTFCLEIWRELPHCFPLFAVLPESKVAIDRMAEFMSKGILGELPRKYGSSDPDSGRPRGARRKQPLRPVPEG